MLVANHDCETDLWNAPEHMHGKIGAAGVVTNVFGERLLAPVPSFEAGLYSYRRNGKSPDRVITIIM